MKKHFSIRIYGKVQGVFFRDSTKAEAIKLNVQGFVRNEPDGSILIEAEGEAQMLNQFLYWSTQGPKAARVESLQVREGELKSYRDFVIER